MTREGSSTGLAEAGRDSTGRLPWSRATLAAILVAYTVGQVAMILAGTGLFLSHDEANFLLEGMRLPVQLKMSGYAHGPFVYELMAAMELVWYLFARLLGQVTTPVEHLANVLADPGPHVKAARLLIAAAGLVCLVQLYRFTRHLASRWAAVLATLLCATSLTFGVWTGLAKEDAIYWLLLLTAGDLIWRSGPADRLRPALAGAAIAVGFATKYWAIFGMILALVPLLRGDRPRRMAVRQGLIMGGAALVTVLVVFPFIVTDTRNLLSFLQGTSAGLAAMSSSPRIVGYLVHHIPTIAGPFVAVAALAELVIRLRQQPRGPILLFLPVVVMLGIMVLGRGYTAAHYAFPVALFAFVLAAAFADRIAVRLRGPGFDRRLWPLPYAALVAVALLDPAYLPTRIKYAVLASGPDSRVLAAEKVAELVPDGACVVITGGVAGWNNQGPALSPAEVTSRNPAGTFAAAERLAIEKRPRPRYRLHVVDDYFMPDEVPASCDWLVNHYIGRWSPLEFGNHGRSPEAQRKVPAGFIQVAEVKAYPELHSHYFPFLSSLDYQELQSTPLDRLRRERVMGASYAIHRRAVAGSAAELHRQEK